MVHLPVSKARLIGNDELNVIVAGNIGGGHHRKLAPVNPAIKADGANQSARNCAANRQPVPHAFAFDIVHITRAAQQLVHPFFSGEEAPTMRVVVFVLMIPGPQSLWG